ncbi:MAG TPA: DUF4340 domain-containing protein [Burkholderiales bacterium]
MSRRAVLILVILLAALGGGALLYQQQERARRPENAAALGRPLFKDLKAAEIASIRIAEPGATLTLRRGESGWSITERAGFPADVAKVREFALKLLELKVGQSEPLGEKDRARLALDDSGVRVELAAADGKALAVFIVGRKYFKREVDNPAKAPGDGRFVLLPADPKTVTTVADPLLLATSRSAEWIDRASFKVEKVKSVDVRFPGGGAWRIERGGDNADWKLAGARAGEKLEVTKANAASYSLSLLELADVAPAGIANTGLDKPILVNAVSLDGRSYAIKVGRLEGDNYYVSFTAAKPTERDALLARHVLLIPKSRLEDTLRPRAELLEKKPAKK